MMIPVEIESPYSGNVERNLSYLRDAMRDCLLRGEAPIASHALYTQDGVLDDDIEEERKLGMEAGKAWTPFVDYVICYVDLGVSGGMKWGIKRALELGKKVVFRRLPEWSELRCLDGHVTLKDLGYGSESEFDSSEVFSFPQVQNMPQLDKICVACGHVEGASLISVKPGSVRRHF